jgi:parallel beta-helix repeat protein
MFSRRCLSVVFMAAGLVAATFVASLFVVSCGEDSPVKGENDDGGIQPPPPGFAAVTVVLALWDDLSGQGPVPETPGDVDELRLEISAPDMQTLTRTVAATPSPMQEVFTVAQGRARYIEVEAFDAADSLLYRGARYTDVVDSVLATGLGLVGVADDEPPVYSGLDGAVVFSGSYAQLSWRPATDGGSPTPDASYLIYRSTAPGAADYSAPSYATDAGATSYLVTDLEPSTTYYFVARAMDRAGNVDDNTNEISLTTFSASQALYVDINTGTDNAACGGPGSPCRTITYALGKAGDNTPVHVVKGTYDEAGGEAFPLQLKPGTSLIGEGYWFKGVKVVQETFIEGPSPVIHGADGAAVISCYVSPTGYGSAGGAIDDAGYPIRIYHCTVDGTLYPGGLGVGFGGGSSLIDSRIEGFDGGGGRAVGVWGTGGVTIKGNVVKNNGQGIFVLGPNSVVSHNIIVDNLFDAVNIGNSHDILVFHNHISDNGAIGVNVSDCDNLTIRYNSISNCGSYGVSITGQQSTYMADISLNSIVKGASAGVNMTSGGATFNSNTIVCNVAGIYLQTDQVVDLRRNSWENNPPTINPGRQYEPGCAGFYDICYARDYALTPEPLYLPSNMVGTCIVFVLSEPQTPSRQ